MEEFSDQVAESIQNPRRPPSTPKDFAELATTRPKAAFLYALFAASLYIVLFYFTGSLLASLFHLPKWPSVGLVMLLRMCLT